MNKRQQLKQAIAAKESLRGMLAILLEKFQHFAWGVNLGIRNKAKIVLKYR
jgi:hypothetical protein